MKQFVATICLSLPISLPQNKDPRLLSGDLHYSEVLLSDLLENPYNRRKIAVLYGVFVSSVCSRHRNGTTCT